MKLIAGLLSILALSALLCVPAFAGRTQGTQKPRAGGRTSVFRGSATVKHNPGADGFGTIDITLSSTRRSTIGVGRIRGQVSSVTDLGNGTKRVLFNSSRNNRDLFSGEAIIGANGFARVERTLRPRIGKTRSGTVRYGTAREQSFLITPLPAPKGK